MEAQDLEILIVDDDESTTEMETRVLSRSGRQSHAASSVREAVALLGERPFAAVLLDYRLPDGEPWPVLDAARAVVPAIPVIFVTGMGDERIAAEVLRRGGSDYLIKTRDYLDHLPATVERVLDGAAGKLAMARLAAIVDSADDAIIGTTLAGDIIAWNSGAERTYGYSAAATEGRNISMLYPGEHDSSVSELFEEIGRGKRFSQLETVHAKRDGTQLDVSLTLCPIVDGRGRPTAVSVIARDVSKLKRAEESLVEKARLASLAADIGVAQTRGEPLQDTLCQCADAIVRHLEAACARIWTLNADERVLELQASAGACVSMDADHGLIPVGKLEVGLIAHEKRAYLTNDVQNDPRVTDEVWARREGVVSFAGYPLMVEGELVGVMAVSARSPLTEFTLHGLETIADMIALGIRRKTAERAQSELEARLRQAQKMEAIGQLAGGVAHDFNNLLTVVIGHSDLLELKLGATDIRKSDVDEIRAAANRAASLTQQLLAFSRQQVLQPKVLDLRDTVRNVEKLLRRLIGEDIELETASRGKLGLVRADPGQLEQVLMNLAINARDAMPHGGRLTIQLSNVLVDERYSAVEDVKPGPYVMVSVSDTGVGMDESVRARVFEPFFTTKEPGKGTGLGLATVYGIVKQTGGHITIYSEPGNGSIFRIYLPEVDAEKSVAGSSRAATPLHGSETVLLVEDEALVRNLARQILVEFGYTVLVAGSGEEAMRVSASYDGPIHLLLSDVVMPGGSGREWAEQLVKSRPDTKVLYMSGYADDAVVQRGLVEMGVAFLQKPFTAAGLTRKIRDVLAP